VPLANFADSLPRSVVLPACLLLAVILGVLHVVAGPDLAFDLFYIGPVSLAAWVVGRRGGLAVAAVSAGAWLLADLLGRSGATHDFTTYWNAASRFATFAVVTGILDALRTSMAHERAIARTDFLTGANNGRMFRELVDRELLRLRRFGRPLTIAYLDLDNFKVVNDQRGHAAGDTLLRAVASMLVRSLRATDVVARLGGDEFAVILPETGPEPAWVVLRKLHNALRIMLQEEGWAVTVSVGAISCLQAPASADELVRMADRLMYEAKRTGKDQVHIEVYAPVASTG
jgi:diguanylate cyclase (GGDEF)-like protein